MVVLHTLRLEFNSNIDEILHQYSKSPEKKAAGGGGSCHAKGHVNLKNKKKSNFQQCEKAISIFIVKSKLKIMIKWVTI